MPRSPPRQSHRSIAKVGLSRSCTVLYGAVLNRTGTVSSAIRVGPILLLCEDYRNCTLYYYTVQLPFDPVSHRVLSTGQQLRGAVSTEGEQQVGRKVWGKSIGSCRRVAWGCFLCVCVEKAVARCAPHPNPQVQNGVSQLLDEAASAAAASARAGSKLLPALPAATDGCSCKRW